MYSHVSVSFLGPILLTQARLKQEELAKLYFHFPSPLQLLLFLLCSLLPKFFNTMLLLSYTACELITLEHTASARGGATLGKQAVQGNRACVQTPVDSFWCFAQLLSKPAVPWLPNASVPCVMHGLVRRLRGASGEPQHCCRLAPADLPSIL